MVKKGRLKLPLLAVLVGGAAFLSSPLQARAQETIDPEPGLQAPGCASLVGRIVSLEGAVERRVAGSTDWRPAMADQPLCAGDAVRTGAYSRAALALVNDSVLRLDQATTLEVGPAPVMEEEPSILGLIRGIIQVFSHRPRSLSITTPFVNAAVEGTEFVVAADADRASVTVLQGRVRASNPQGSVALDAAGTAEAHAGGAPVQRLTAHPRDAAQWALYCQPVLTPMSAQGAAERAGLPAPVAEALALNRQGDPAGAIARLDRALAAENPAPEVGLYRDAILMSVGRLDEAWDAIGKTLSRNPNHAGALALRSVIAVTVSDRASALADARRAVELDPRSAPARIALSYALQADLQPEAARETLEEAVAIHPEDPLLRSRLAEILLVLGYRADAETRAREAAELAPDMGEAQTILGLAALVRQDPGEAQQVLERAVVLDPSDPLPRLGLGLALIRQGGLEAGRTELEIAAGLDPGNSLVRSYLGRAYDEERRGDRATGQYGVAKELDPLDPTPFFYDGLRKRAANRPVEALADIQKSIELNDNRAPFRSEPSLDEDLATRGAALGRVYNDLGFDRLGLPQAAKALSADPASAAADRFLSDIYAPLERHEVAQSSALLRSQLLQPLTIDPVQPSLTATDLHILPGAFPSEAGFNEYGPLFERDRIRLDATGVAGNLGTLADEIMLSGIVGRAAFSAGQFHYQSDGYRENNDVEHNIYTLFGQAALTDTLSVQAEFRSRRTEQDDLTQSFDPDDFSPTERTNIDQDTARLGLRYSPTPRVDLLASVIASERDSTQLQANDFFNFTDDIEQRGIDAQVQGIYRGDIFNVTAGGGAYRVRQKNVATFEDLLSGESFPIAESFTNRQSNAYGYVNLMPLSDVIFTVGLSADHFDNGVFDFDKLNPKLGIQWDVTDRLKLRTAAFRTFKRLLIVDQTLEPTQVAGFNQFTDDFNQTSSWVKGIGLDAVLARGAHGPVYGGAEYTRRDLDVPQVLSREPPASESRDLTEDEVRAYLYWATSSDWAFSAEFEWDEFENENELVDVVRLRTMTVPLQVRYFAENGLFAKAGVNFVSQEVEERLESFFDQTRENFVTVDLGVGYRLPERRGSVSLEVRNLFDEEFLYEDLDSITNTTTRPRFIPARTILGRLSLSF